LFAKKHVFSTLLSINKDDLFDWIKVKVSNSWKHKLR